MTLARGRFRHGEPISLAREVVTGDPAGYTVEACLKPTVGQSIPGPETPPIATFAVSFQPAVPGVPARWLMTISAAAAAAAGIGPGRYVTDARFLLAGEVVAVCDPAFITIERSVSGS